MIQLKNISLKYDNKLIFKDLSLKIKTNQKVAILGESGSGKTSLLNLIIGFVKPQTGKIFVNNLELNPQNIRTIRKNIAWLPQGIDMYFENVNEMFFAPFYLNLNKKNKPDNNQIEKIFKAFNLDFDLMNKKVSEISGGQKQRLILASILLTNKKIYLLDEPTSALDTANASLIAEYLKKLDATIIAASHDQDFFSKMDYTINLNKLIENE